MDHHTRSTHWLPAGLAVLVTACSSPLVIQPRPAVRFVEPQGAVLFIKSEGGVLRAKFDGKLRNPPLVCKENLAQVATNRRSGSLRHTLAGFARSRGHARVQLHAADGKILGKGRLCIFPLLRTRDEEVKKGYVIRVPLALFERTRQGKPAMVFQTYAPENPDAPGWLHVAWILWFAPDL